MKSYPKGAIRQHKRLATGEGLVKANTKNLGGDCNLKGGMGKGGRISSSGDTGGGYKTTPPTSSPKTPA
jgi:hypothetical protein